MVLSELDNSWIGKRIVVHKTQIIGTLDEVKSMPLLGEMLIVVNGESYFLPRNYPVSEHVGPDDYDPSVLLGVVDPWSPIT